MESYMKSHLSGAWHRTTPRGLTLGLFLGLLALAGAGYWEAQQFTPLQSDRFRFYLLVSTKAALKIDQSEYTLMMVENAREKKLYYPNERLVEPGRTATKNGILPFQLTEEARRQGDRLDAYHFKDWSNAEVAEKL